MATVSLKCSAPAASARARPCQRFGRNRLGAPTGRFRDTHVHSLFARRAAPASHVAPVRVDYTPICQPEQAKRCMTLPAHQ
eukprot:6111192-Pleurochrysis_carterae.AAC.1